MKEEQFKTIIEKSTLETSDDFINNLMSSIEVNQERKKSLHKLFKVALSGITIIMVVTSFILYKYLENENSLVNALTNIPKTPLFVIFMVILLGYINTFIRLNEQNKIQ